MFIPKSHYGNPGRRENRIAQFHFSTTRHALLLQFWRGKNGSYYEVEEEEEEEDRQSDVRKHYFGAATVLSRFRSPVTQGEKGLH
jgi:hypothetical protein